MTDEPDGMDAAAVDWQEEYEGWLNDLLNQLGDDDEQAITGVR